MENQETTERRENIKTLTIVILCWLVGLTAKVHTDGAKAIYARTVRSIVLIETRGVVHQGNVDIPIGHSGTGFSIGNGKILTCAHMVTRAEKITITDSRGRSEEVKVFHVDGKHDLATLMVNMRIPALHFGTNPRKMDIVRQIGNPGPLRFILTEGRFMGNDGKQNVYDITTYPGNSGSPILNERGEVVGMTQAVSGSRITFGSSLEDIARFLKS